MKRLFFDIETSPNIGFFWQSGHEISVDAHNIIRERAIICIGYKWAGERAIRCPTWDARQNDKKLLAGFAEIFNGADEVVAHNGDRFDIPWIRTRCLTHGISMLPNPKSIDTCALARRRFNFNSNRLDYLAQYMGFGGKLPTGFDLWKDVVLHRDEAALAKMVRYCKRDVALLERVWDKMNAYVPAKTHAGGSVGNCPECGSSQTTINQKRVTAAGYRQVTIKCRECGKYHTVAESRYERARKEARGAA
jgi:uncharacterized protein YprB with RNaseH-like and TPR domain